MSSPVAGPAFLIPTATFYPGATFHPDINETATPFVPPVSGVFIYSKSGQLFYRGAAGEQPLSFPVDPVNGLIIQGVTGSSFDLTIEDGLGNPAIQVGPGFAVFPVDTTFSARVLARGTLVEIDGTLQHKGADAGFFNVVPTTQQASGGTLAGVIAGLVALGLFSS